MVGISVYRAYTLFRPLASRHEINPGTIHKALTGYSVFAAVYILGGVGIMGQYYFFDPFMLACIVSGLTNPTQLDFIYNIVATVIFVSVPLVGIITANLAILVLVARARGGIPGINAVRTVSCISWIFLISVIPTNVRLLLQLTRVTIPTWFYIMAQELLFMNAVVNPIIYTATNRGFRAFLIKLLSRKLATIRQIPETGEYLLPIECIFKNRVMISN